jgi:MFS family permease
MSVGAYSTTRHSTGNLSKTASVAWLVASLFYFYQYVQRSSPSVMMPQLSDALGKSTLEVASIVSFFYYGYSTFSLAAGASMDRLGLRQILPIAAAAAGIGALLFATGNSGAASFGRFLQGAAGGFAPVGAIYIATTRFPASMAATLIGATQMFGMAGGAAGQFLVAPLIAGGTSCKTFWLHMGIAGFCLGVLLLIFLPAEPKKQKSTAGLSNTISGFASVFKNPQSIYCGLIAGLLFIPTTIFTMIWGVRYLQEAHAFDYTNAVLRSASIPVGWIIGCPLLGYISDRIGRRRPVIIGGALVLFACFCWILFAPPGLLPPYTVGLLAGIASGAAMIPYTVIKEANPPHLGGTATGVISFLNFSLSALLAPAFTWILRRSSLGADRMELPQYRTAFAPMLLGIAVAVVLTFLLKETGKAPTAAVLPLKRAA